MKNKKYRGELKVEATLEYGNSIIATLREPFLVLDKDLKVILANQSFYNTFKANEKDTIGRSLSDLGNGQWNIPGLLVLLKEILPEKRVVENYEIEHDFKEIGRRYMSLNACQLRTPKEIAGTTAAEIIIGEYLILLAIEDITERRRLQEELKESEERYRRAFETSRDGLLLVHKTEGSILNSNESAQELLGYSHEELLKKKLWAIGVTKNNSDFQETVSRLEKDGLIHYEDIPVKTKKNLSINTDVFLVNKAKVMQCNIRDITERKLMEDKLLQAKEEQYRTLIENLPGKVFLKDRNSVYISCNESYAKDLKIKPQEIVGKTDHDFFPTYLAEKYRRDDKRVMDSGKTENIEEEYMVIKDFLRGAQKAIIDTVKVPVRDEDGSVTGLFGLFWDITERKKAEEELSYFQKAVDSSTDAIGIATPEGRHYYQNEAFTKLFGFSVNETDSALRSLKTIYVNEKAGRNIFDTIMRGDIWTGEVGMFTKDKRRVDISLRAYPIKSKEGKIISLVGVHTDITERKNTEARREMALKWQQNTNTLRQSLLASDTLEHKLKIITDGIVRIFDADFCRIWLIKPGDLCKKGCIHAEVPSGPHLCRYKDRCLHLITSSGRYTHIDGRSHARVPFGCYKIGLIASGEEHKFLTNDVINDPRVHNHEWARKLGLVSFTGYQLKVPGGETIGVLALFSKHKITPDEDAMLDSFSATTAFVVQQNIAEDGLRKADAIKASTEMKSKFTSMVSHELRSPMAVIKESINLVLEELVGSVTPEQKDVLETAKSNIDRLGRLINNVLDFQKIEAGKMELNIKEYDLNEVALATSKEMNILAEEKGLSFTVNIDKSLPIMKFDKDRIVQVITNLLSNAIKFTEKGGISVSIEREDNMAHVTVEDTGHGIQVDDIPKLFQIFEQVGGGLGRKIGGTGLGLAISKEIIYAHNGKIWAESRFGKGSTFHFILPVKERRG